MGRKKTVERDHALLSASSAERWLYCTPSARLEETLPDSTSEYAAEGTLAHSICELKLSRLFTDQNMSDRTYKSRLKKLQGEALYKPEMERYTDEYVDYVSQIAYGFPGAPFVAVEKRVDYSQWAPEGFGTCDCTLIYGDQLHVIDFKYGRGVAKKAEGNPQMSLYSLGAYAEYGMLFGLEQVTMHIFQPRINNISSWTASLKELLDWGELIVKPRAEKAYHGEGGYTPAAYADEDSNNYCRFCRAYGRCRATADKYMPLMETAMDGENGCRRMPPLLSWEEVGGLLKKVRFLRDWAGKMEDAALSRIVSGEEVPGWKVIEGRSNRKIGDTDAAFKELVAAGYAEEVLYNKEPIPLGEIEGLLSKEHREEILKKYIIRPQGKPKLVPEDDKRPAMQLKTTAEEAFGGGNTYKEENGNGNNNG